ncbi:MAG: hypothetical protein HC881_06495 [Leptolyngbyaceae cyanobacterium SL_7_1]|nr:hypothetical protein [Leptolyngbyaceae cyanobacterium SL_7_1]
MPIHLSQIEHHLKILQQQIQTSGASQPQPVMAGRDVPAAPIAPTPAVGAALVFTNQAQAKRGNPDAVARYLSETLSLLGVSVKVSVKTTPYPAQSAATAQLITPDAGAAVSQRLWITCEALYSPDPMLAGEPIAQQVRDLQLEGFRDAVIVMQVRGELTPDWLLQVDLTPTQDMLREWARWGGCQRHRPASQPHPEWNGPRTIHRVPPRCHATPVL